MAWDFVMNFARDNRLQVTDADALPQEVRAAPHWVGRTPTADRFVGARIAPREAPQTSVLVSTAGGVILRFVERFVPGPMSTDPAFASRRSRSAAVLVRPRRPHAALPLERTSPVGAEAGLPTIWVLLRGLSRESGHWGVFPLHLREQIRRLQPDAQMLLLDLPGNGVMHRQISPTHVHEMVDACRDELLRRAVNGPVHLLAMSLARWWSATGRRAIRMRSALRC